MNSDPFDRTKSDTSPPSGRRIAGQLTLVFPGMADWTGDGCIAIYRRTTLYRVLDILFGDVLLSCSGSGPHRLRFASPSCPPSLPEVCHSPLTHRTHPDELRMCNNGKSRTSPASIDTTLRSLIKSNTDRSDGRYLRSLCRYTASLRQRLQSSCCYPLGTSPILCASHRTVLSPVVSCHLALPCSSGLLAMGGPGRAVRCIAVASVEMDGKVGARRVEEAVDGMEPRQTR